MIVLFFSLVFLVSIQSIWDKNSIHINQHAYAKQDQPIYMSHLENESSYGEEKAEIMKQHGFHRTCTRGSVSVTPKHQKKRKKETVSDILAVEVKSPLPKSCCEFLSMPSWTRDKRTEAKFSIPNKHTHRSCMISTEKQWSQDSGPSLQGKKRSSRDFTWEVLSNMAWSFNFNEQI